MQRLILAMVLAVSMVACGGGGGGGNSAETPPDSGSNPGGTELISGRFVDNPVAGLGYRYPGGEGITGEEGEFLARGLTEFFIGDIVLGAAEAGPFLTPVDFMPELAAEAESENNPAITNIARLLQTLDVDRDARNGIQLPPTIHDIARNRGLTFAQTVRGFEQDPALQSFIRAATGNDKVKLVPVQVARYNLRQTLDHIALYGEPNRLPKAEAGADQEVDAGDTVTLDGSASFDPDPRPETAKPGVIKYRWKQLSGPTVALTPDDKKPALARFTPQVAGDAVLVFRLTVVDDDGARRSDTVRVKVRAKAPTNKAPVAEDASHALFQGQALSAQATAFDEDGDDLEFSLVSEPSYGSLSFESDGSFVYRPEQDFVGLDGFGFRVSDGAATSKTAWVSLDVQDLPVAQTLVGAAKRIVTPLQEHIDGVEESRFLEAPRTQRFNLGGFGIDPLQNLPDPVAGFGDSLTEPAAARVLETEHGPEHTWVRAMVMTRRNDDGSDTLLAFVTLDAIGAGNLIQDGLKRAVNEATGIPPENILFGQTHTHAGADLQGLWGGVPQSWIDNPVDDNGLYQLAAQAVREAMDIRRPAKLIVSRKELPDYNNYRRPQIFEDARPDETATLLRAYDTHSGTLLASMLQYNAHPTNIGASAHEDVEGLEGRVPHADYVLGLVETLEAEGGVALYYNGPIADAAPSGPGGDNAYDRARRRGEGIASATLGGTEDAVVLADQLSVRHQTVMLPVTNPLFTVAGALGAFNRYYDFLQLPLTQIPGLGTLLADQYRNLPQLALTAETLVSRVTLGEGEQALEIVTIPGEATHGFGKYIQSLAGYRRTMLLGLTHNSFGYILPEEEFNYINEVGETGLLPYTNYEEFVSFGPLTAPLLRVQGYNPLFDAPPQAYLPPSLSACFGVDNGARCIVEDIAARPGWYQRAYGERCREAFGDDSPFCLLVDPDSGGGGLGDACRALGGPEALCAGLDFGQAPTPPDEGEESPEEDAGGGLFLPAMDARLRGCDLLDTSHCMLPFPSDHFTRADARTETGKRVNFRLSAMPRNLAGKPIDPTEWNRNDGFSPGAMIVSYVPGLDLEATGAAPLTDIERSLAYDAPIQVLDAETGEPQLIWAELDANAGMLLPSMDIEAPGEARPALIVRPARNLVHGRRYVVVLRKLRDSAGELLSAGAGFQACRDNEIVGLGPVEERCAALEQDVFPVLAAAGIERDESLYLAWDFTVASSQNLTERLLHMRDDAFATLGESGRPGDPDYQMGAAPKFSVDKIIEHPDANISRRVEGVITVPSYVLPGDPAPLRPLGALTVIDELRARAPEQFDLLFDGVDVISSLSLPPNRLFYNPLDGTRGGLGFGDGLPDRPLLGGQMKTRFICDIPRAAVDDFADAGRERVRPARASLYGHGLLGSRSEVGAGNVEAMANEHNMMFCAVDWFGFATGDVPNILLALIDLSLFGVIPDASQQGILNQLFLARLLRHPEGFAAHEAFQVDGRPVFDHRHVFYDGNSQGGIMAGPVLALSKDISRGVLGVPGMNYSTLLRRSVDFDAYSLPMYLSYRDDLDRTLNFGLIQMLWDRSENNGYAQHLTGDPLPGTEPNRVLLHPAFGDHQVTMWSADVMARTVDAAVDGSRIAPGRHPDSTPYAGLRPLEYDAWGRADTSAMVVWDAGPDFTPPPPVNNTPPREGEDPHAYPRSQVSARCQKSHFLHAKGAVIDVSTVLVQADCPPLPYLDPPDYVPPVAPPPQHGGGLLGLLADIVGSLGETVGDVTSLLALLQDPASLPTELQARLSEAPQALETRLAGLAESLLALVVDEEEPSASHLVLGLYADVVGLFRQALEDPQGLPQDLADLLRQVVDDGAGLIGLNGDAAARDVEPVVLSGALFPDWAAPAAFGFPNNPLPAPIAEPVRDAHDGTLLVPPALFEPVPVEEIAAYRWENGRWVEIPVQVDERFLYFLSNDRSDFGAYSGTDPELTYAWDDENWKKTATRVVTLPDGSTRYEAAYPPGEGPTPDPVPGLDADDEIVFMASDTGLEAAPLAAELPPGVQAAKKVVLVDPLDPDTLRYVYIARQPGGSSFSADNGYVRYQRWKDADEWIDRNFFRDDDPEKLGSSNRGYGANLQGPVSPPQEGYFNYDRAGCVPGSMECFSEDRFPRDGLTVTTERYRWEASGRWMVRDIRIAPPRPSSKIDWYKRPDLIDRWKGRAFQQTPDSDISLVGFEDEQVNWEANASLLGERCGPVRCIRETWGADSGTNVTKTETFYRDSVAYRFRVRVHPIPPDGLYTNWDYNRDVAARYYNALRPEGVAIDGVPDDLLEINELPVPGCGTLLDVADSLLDADIPGIFSDLVNGSLAGCATYFDFPDPSFNFPLGFMTWEQVSGRGDAGSLVYIFELKGLTTLTNPVIVPYYRDDACFDDGTGDDPVPRPWPGERSTDERVQQGYLKAAQARGRDVTTIEELSCADRQGSYGSHGIHILVLAESDNLFTGLPTTELDGQQWQFMVPTDAPRNVGQPYANTVRVPLQPLVLPVP